MAGNIRDIAKRFLIATAVLSLAYLLVAAAFEPGALGPLRGQAEDGAEEAVLKDTVVLFNKILSDLYASDGVPARLNEFPASTQLRHELFKHVGFLRNRGQVLVYDMADLVFVEVKKTTETTAEVIAFEEWNYIYQDLRTRRPVERIKGMGQGFRYVLAKKDGRWIVVDYYPVDVAMGKKDEFLY